MREVSVLFTICCFLLLVRVFKRLWETFGQLLLFVLEYEVGGKCLFAAPYSLAKVPFCLAGSMHVVFCAVGMFPHNGSKIDDQLLPSLAFAFM